MTRLFLTAGIGLVLILSLCTYQIIMIQDYFGDPGAEAAELGKRFENVPKEIGEWKGEDLPVDEIVKNTAGAVNYVSRRYINTITGEEVTLWLIIGHSRDIRRHTPNICYPNSGFRGVGNQLRHHIDLPDGETSIFYTAKFEREDPLTHHVQRVFWAWNEPDVQKWEAPDSARVHYGTTPTLYKLYFTSPVTMDETTIDENAAAKFAEAMLPAINDALFLGEGATEADEAKASEAEIQSTAA